MQDNEVAVAAVRQQVQGLESRHTELRDELRGVETEMRRGFQAVDVKIAAGFQAVDDRVGAGFQAVATKLDQKTTPHWQAYTVIAMVMIAVCGALFWPIRDQASKHDAAIEQLTANTTKLTRDLGFLEGQLHPLPK